MISRRAFMEAIGLATAAAAAGVGAGKATKHLYFDRQTPGFREVFEKGEEIFIPVTFPREEGICWDPEGGPIPTRLPAVTTEIRCRVFTNGEEPIFEYRGKRYGRNELFAEVSWRSLQGKPL